MSSTLAYSVLVPALSVLAVLAWRYPDRCIGTHSRPDLPGPKGIPIIGNMLLVFAHRDRMLGLLHKLEANYGPLFTFTLPYWGRNIVVNRPEWLDHVKKRDTIAYTKGDVVRDVFSQFPGPNTPVATDGAAWRSARKMMQPVFSMNSVNNHASEAMAELVPTILELLRNASKNDIAVEFNDFAGRIALTVFCKMAFSIDTGLITPELSSLYSPNRIADDLWVLNEISNNRLFNPAWRITQFFDGTYWQFHRSKQALLKVVDDLMHARASETADYAGESDYLNTLLAGHDETDVDAMKDTLMTLLLAGRDSTQATISWAIYELTRKPEWISALRKEIKSQQTLGTVLAFGDSEKYPIHLAVLYETLRLWPGLPKNARIAAEDDILPAIPELGIEPVHVHKGDFVLWSDYSMMRNELVWGADAGSFNPGRHLDADGKFIRPSLPKFHGFGCGPRACPGKLLSTYEFIAVISGIISHFDIVPSDTEPRQMVDAFTSLMDGTFYLKFKELDVEL
ncbi:cytochrome P450 [Cyathus striatus]|nr:cytochrome P450 [Cyathus striatus]